MNKKKVMINLLVIILAFALFITWYQRFIHVTVKVTTNQNNILNVYLITQDNQSEFYQTVNHGAADMAELLKINYQWIAPSIENMEEQSKFINRAVQEGADLILLAAIDPEAVSEAIQNAQNNNVKIIYVDSPAREEAITTLATDNYRAGRMAGENMLQELTAIGIENGSLGIISNSPTIQSVRERELGFIDYITEDGKFKLIETAYDNAKVDLAFQAANDMIDKNADLVGVFATNEQSTEGLGNAIRNKNSSIIAIGFDRSNATMDMLKKGYLNTVLVQNPYTMGYLGMAEAYAALNGYGTGPSYFDTGVNALMQETIVR